VSAAVVSSLTRYPVKSVGGEPQDALTVEARGVSGDRLWAVYTADGGIGSGKNSRRFRRVDGLLEYSGRLRDGQVVLVAPDGSELVAGASETDEVLSAAFGQPLEVRHEGAVSHFDESPLHVITTSSLRALGALLGGEPDPRRFRANVVVDVPGAEFVEQQWIGRQVAVGDVVLHLTGGMPRCVMTTVAQQDLPTDSRVLKALGEHADMLFGFTVDVVRGGTVRLGDRVTLA
jgi:hypothetical protein